MRTEPPGYELVRANGADVAFLSEGSGPLVVLLHGYPDTARGWLPVMGHLAAAGYRAVAPSLPGYPPSGPSPRDDYSVAEGARTVLAFAEVLGADCFYLCGVDWGYFLAFAATHLDPDSVARLAAGHAHPASVGFTDPRVTWAARHAVMNQLPWLAKRVIARNDFAYIDKLYRRWAPTWTVTPDVTADAKATLSQPGVLDDALKWYRALLRAELLPGGRPTRRLLKQRTRVPTLLFRGSEDRMTVDKWWTASPALFPEGCRIVDLPGVGHFPHREDPASFAAMLLDFFGPAAEAPS
ncbi:MAG TPA: alpha/beta hydrolase [Acidimicrobiia bacterium]|nr:alpha/beta hydrolase [Acidimicrobiia bacterium]